MNSIRIYRILFKNFSFAHLSLIENYDQGAALRKESVIATFMEQFKIATLRKSYWWILLVIRAICLTISFLSIFFIETYEQYALRKELIIAPLTERFQTATMRKFYW